MKVTDMIILEWHQSSRAKEKKIDLKKLAMVVNVKPARTV
jgi:hypothetical protein